MTKRNVEQTEEITTDQGILAADQADLDRVFAQRELARQARADELAKDKVALADAQEALAKAKAGGDKLTLAQAQLAVHEAEVSLQAAQEARQELDTGADATKLATVQAAVDKKRLAVSEAEIRAGRHATGGAVRRHDPGDQRRRGRPGDGEHDRPDPGQPEDDAGGGVGGRDDDPAGERGAGGDDRVDAFPGQSFTGKVLSVPLQGTLQGGVMVYDVPISLDGAEESGAAGRHDRQRRDSGRAGRLMRC